MSVTEYKKRTKQSGVGLVELLIGMAVALVLLSGVMATAITAIESGGDNIESVRVQTQARSIMDHVNRELQRAGYINVVDPTAGTALSDMVSVDGLTALENYGNIFLSGCDGNGRCSCVVYSYDFDEDGLAGLGGSLDPRDDSERFGIHFTNNSVRFGRLSGSNAADCSDGDWETISDTEITVNNFYVQLDPTDFARYVVDPADLSIPANYNGAGIAACAAGLSCFERRRYNLFISASAADDADITVQIVGAVKVKNDWYYVGS